MIQLGPPKALGKRRQAEMGVGEKVCRGSHSSSKCALSTYNGTGMCGRP